MPQGPPRHPFGKLIGLHFAAAPGDGRAHCFLDAGPHLHNPGGILHGGVVFSMADTAMGAALWTLVQPGHTTSTVEIKINYLEPVVAGRLDCTCRVIHRNDTVGVVEADVRQGETLVATALGTFAILKHRAPPSV